MLFNTVLAVMPDADDGCQYSLLEDSGFSAPAAAATVDVLMVVLLPAFIVFVLGLDVRAVSGASHRSATG